MAEYLKTPEEVSRELHEDFHFGQAKSIAAEVYQPFCACVTKGCKYCDR